MIRVPVKDYEGYYEVTEDGRIFSVERTYRNRWGSETPVHSSERKLSEHCTGYLTIRLAKNGVAKTHRVHRLVATAFIPNPENKNAVNHKNGNKHDNMAVNLEWCTGAENSAHAASTGLSASGERNGGCKITDQQVLTAAEMVTEGLLIQDVAVSLGVNRNTITKRLNKMFGSSWDVPLNEKRSRAARVRYGTYTRTPLNHKDGKCPQHIST